MRCAGLLVAVVLLAALCSCGGTGSRDTQPNVWAGGVGGYWWDGATAQEQQWLTETLNLHAKLMAKHLGGIPRVDVHFYRSPLDLSRAAVMITVGQRPNTYNLTRIRSVFTINGVGEAFLHRGAVHIYCGPKIEGQELAHAMFHAVVEPAVIHHVNPNVNGTAFRFRGSHADPRWNSLLTDDFLLSLQLAAQR